MQCVLSKNPGFCGSEKPGTEQGKSWVVCLKEILLEDTEHCSSKDMQDLFHLSNRACLQLNVPVIEIKVHKPIIESMYCNLLRYSVIHNNRIK